MRLLVSTSHPIQYQAPLFRALAKRCDLEVLFAHRQSAAQQAGAGFGTPFDWDVDLLSGYRSRFMQNRARRPSVEGFWGTDVPDVDVALRDARPDAVVVMGWYLRSYWQTIRAARRQKIPVIVRGESQMATPRSLVRRLAKEVGYRWVMKQFDGFLYIGERNKVYLRHYGARPERMFFSPYVVDNDWFDAQGKVAAPLLPALRAGLGIGTDERIILFSGKLIEKKRPTDIVRALKLLADRQVRARLLVVGSGPLQDEMERLAWDLGVKVHFLGFQNQSEIPRWYALADLLVLPSDGGETWGLVVNEAMACGTPAVVSDAVGCGPDLIESGRTGEVFALGDIHGLAAALAAMLDCKHDPLVQAALAAKLARYSMATAATGFLEAAHTSTRQRRDRR